MKYTWIASAVTVLVSVVCAEFTVPTSVWENVEYSRNIDLSRSYVKEDHVLKIKNIAQEPSQIYYFTVPREIQESIAILIPSVTKSGSKLALVASELEETSEGLSFFKIQLPFPVAPKATFEFQVSLVITGQIKPLPEKVAEQQEEQSLVFYTNKLPNSIYPTAQYALKYFGFQSTVDELPISGVPEETQQKYAGKPVKEVLVYGPFDLSGEPPLTQVPMSLLYNRKVPLMHVNNLKRDVWVSHWSEALQVEEHYQLTNKGVGLKNGFSRVEYMKKKMTHKLNPSINTIEMLLTDPDTTDIYYTDLVGNVSTSVVLDKSLLLKPRYPIFGGWNYNFTIGWNNQLSKYVHSLAGGQEHILRVPIINGPRDCAYDEVDLNVLLPAGAEVIEVQSPLAYDSYDVDHYYSYLDTMKGHTRVSMEFSNLIDEMRNVQVLVKYRYTTADQWSQIISISVYVFVAFLAFIGVKSIDIRIDNRTKKNI